MDNPDLKCFSCEATFKDDKDFWDHVYNADCGGEAVGVTPTRKSSPPSSAAKQDNGPHFCGLCGMKFGSILESNDHLKSAEHREKVNKAAISYASASTRPSSQNLANQSAICSRQQLYCNECNVPLPSMAALDAHIIGKKHQKVVARLAETSQNSGSSASNDALLLGQLGGDSSKALVAQKTGNAQLSNSNPFTLHDSNSPFVPSSSTTQYDELNQLLRRLCLTQIWSILHQLEAKGTSEPETKLPANKSFAGVDGDILLQMFRQICVEELHRLLPPKLFTSPNGGF
ncbi:unnamed protein product [Calicophoron daubneyi]|uniref:C2H2-type domain-containing protein n=1 Tax=Calicophoron daubneyi TaxID=300641 RepID=A0AAV2TYN6_CALDB